MVNTPKTLLIESSPLAQMMILPCAVFTGSLSTYLFIYNIEALSFKLSCDGCEIYITETIEIYLSEFELMVLVSSTVTADVNEQIEISYEEFSSIPFYKLFLLNQEVFEYNVIPVNNYKGTAYVTFFTPGVKNLLFYFDDTIFSEIYGITLEIFSAQYSIIEFTTGNVIFI